MSVVYNAGRLWVDVTAEVPVACYPAGQEPDPARAAGVDLGIIHPYAVAGPGGEGLLVSGRAIRAEHRMHLADSKPATVRSPAAPPGPGRKGRGGGGTTGVGRSWPRRGTGGASARPSTKPPKWSSPGPWPGGSALWRSVTPAAC